MKKSLLTLIAIFFLASCGTSNNEAVIGRAGGAHIGAPTTAEVITKSAKGGGVRLTTDVGEGKRAVNLSAIETVRLIDALDKELKAWPTFWRSEPFQRTVAGGITSMSDWTPYSVELIRRAEMQDPVFRLTIGYADAVGSLVLDQQNAKRWLTELSEASEYSPGTAPSQVSP